MGWTSIKLSIIYTDNYFIGTSSRDVNVIRTLSHRSLHTYTAGVRHRTQTHSHHHHARHPVCVSKPLTLRKHSTMTSTVSTPHHIHPCNGLLCVCGFIYKSSYPTMRVRYKLVQQIDCCFIADTRATPADIDNKYYSSNSVSLMELVLLVVVVALWR